MSPSDLILSVPVVSAWSAAAYALPALRRRRDDASFRSFWLSLLFLALALTVLLPAIYRVIDALTGVGNLARLLGNGLVLVAGWQSQALLFHFSFPPEDARRGIRRSGVLLGLTLVVLGVCFALAPVHQEAVDFVGRYADVPLVLGYRLVFLAYVGWTLAAIGRLSWRYARLVARPALRLGLRCTAVGAVLGLGYVANEVLRVVVARLGRGEPYPDPVRVTQILEAGAVVFMLIGTTMPAWGPRAGIPRLVDRVTRHRTYRRLAPLWRALYRACPEIALAPPRAALLDALDPRDLDLRLYRRVVEIRDGCLALRPYFDPSWRDELRGLCREANLPPDEEETVITAAGIALALRAKAMGWKADRPSAAVLPASEGDLASELILLERIAGALAAAPLVRVARRRIDLRAEYRGAARRPGETR